MRTTANAAQPEARANFSTPLVNLVRFDERRPERCIARVGLNKRTEVSVEVN